MITAILDQLTPAQRLAVTQKSRGATRAEIAQREGVSPQAVKKRLSRARKRLLKLMPPKKRRLYATVTHCPPRRVVAAQLSAIPSAMF